MISLRSVRGSAVFGAALMLLGALPATVLSQEVDAEDRRIESRPYQRPMPGRPEQAQQRPQPAVQQGRPEQAQQQRPQPAVQQGAPEAAQQPPSRPEQGQQRNYGRPDQGNVYQRPVPGRPEPPSFRPDQQQRPSPSYNTRPSRPSPDRVVTRLPPGYRPYYWSGSPYYQYDGYWYRPYGSSFVLSAPPYGLYVSTLPPFYSTVFIGGSRYYLADDTYYSYDLGRRSYVVVQPPSGTRSATAAEPAVEPQRDAELYVYPQKGQSEQQQADDRYECHRWAVGQTQYNPVDAVYNPDKRGQYDRALTACLTGKSYSVK